MGLPRRHLFRTVLIAGVFVIQVAGAVFFLYQMLSALLGLPPIPWTIVEILEIAAALCLIIGSAMGAWILRRTLRRNARVEDQLRAASGAFSTLLEEYFTRWSLTPAERDVALFAIKGMSTSEIAVIRQTSEGTVKAQTNAIYRKAGVSGRPQLLSVFIEELMGEGLIPDGLRLSA